jgi:metal-responsive CopG/Arc/MetJ family transcriptional regulator
MVRIQIQLTAEQARNLKKMALTRQVSVSEMIRKAVDNLLLSNTKPDIQERKARALEIAGKYRSGKKDISKKHDDYLARS